KFAPLGQHEASQDDSTNSGEHKPPEPNGDRRRHPLPAVVKAQLGFTPDWTAARFGLVDWDYQGLCDEVECPGCAQNQFHVWRRRYETTQGTYHHWGIVCPTCQKIMQPSDFDRRYYIRLLSWSKGLNPDWYSEGEATKATHGPHRDPPESSSAGSFDLQVPVKNLNFSRRVVNCFRRAQIETLGELLERTPADLMQISQFGAKSLDEVQRTLEKHGLSLKGRKRTIPRLGTSDPFSGPVVSGDMTLIEDACDRFGFYPTSISLLFERKGWTYEGLCDLVECPDGTC
ncbi:uncharacterized protein METZ01_LOCUS395757, partial [marine metagenome]